MAWSMRVAGAALAVVALYGLTTRTALAAPGAALHVENAYARPVPAGTTGAAYLEITNDGATGDRLLSVTSTVGTAEVHEMKMDGDVMRMRKIASLEIPPHATIRLAPGGLHVMLTHLSRPLAAGEHLRLGLRFEHAARIDVDVPVETR